MASFLHSLIKLATILSVLSITLLIGVGYPAFAQGPPEQQSKEDWAVSPLLRHLIQQQESAASQAAPQPDSGAMVRGQLPGNGAAPKGGPAVSDSQSSDYLDDKVRFDSSGNVQVYIKVVDMDDDTLQQLRALGATLEIVNSDWSKLQAWVPVNRLDDIAALDKVREVTLPDYGETNSGSINTEGDSIHRADLVRQLSGLTGKGVRIGVISDGIDDWHTARATGDLPGYIQIDPNRRGRNHEGTAMLEIIHDLAPEAELAFSGAGSSLNFVESILWLANDAFDGEGADIIVDDIAFHGEPYFEDGPVAQGAADAVAGGAVYVTSAGNSAFRHYEADFVDGGDGYHDFEPGPGIDISLRAGRSIFVEATLQWNDQYGASENDYDLFACQAGSKPTRFSLQNRLCWGGTKVQDGDDDPIESAFLSVSEVDFYIRKISGDDRRLELFVSRENRIREHGVPEGSIVAQGAAEGVLAVGAIDAADPGRNDPQPYSDHGPSRIYDYSDDSFTDRPKPDVVGIDGVLVTGSGGFGSSVEGSSGRRFFGTSAAAPHVAAIAALVMEAQRKATPEATRKEVSDAVAQAIRDNAIDLGDDGHDNDTGYGRADALATIQAIAESSSTFSLDPTFSFGTTFTVNSTGDGSDSSTSDGACNDGNGKCTLRAAIQQANAWSGAVIKFNISGSGVQTIQLSSGLPTITKPVFIDGFSQPGASETNLLIELDGASAGTDVSGLTLSGGGSVVRGLVVHSFDGNGIVLQGSDGGQALVSNHIGVNAAGTTDEGNGEAGVYINGAPDVVLRDNVISGNDTHGVHISGSGAKGPVIFGNTIGLNAAGTSDLGNNEAGVYVNGASEAQIRDNTISGNDSHGVSLSGSGANNAVIDSNTIGLNASATADLGNTDSGIHMSGVRDTVISLNVISGNDSHGVTLTGSGTYDTFVSANYIGTNKSDASLGNGGSGVVIESSSYKNSVEGNTIANHTGDGVTVTATATSGNTIRQNSIHSNGGIGIDLNDDGATANDTGDTDTGPNFLQNYPTGITFASRDDAVSVWVNLDVTSSRQYIVDYYECDSSSGGEGKHWLGFTQRGAGITGNTVWSASLLQENYDHFTAPTGTHVTATVTDLFTNSTSEFAPCVEHYDLPGLDLSVNAIEVTEDATTETTYTIALSSQPSATTRVRIIVLFSSVSNIVNPTTGYPYTLSFTTMNWNVPRSVTVFGVTDDDALHESNEIRHQISIGGRDHYTAILPVHVTDDDVPPSLTLTSATTGITFQSDASEPYLNDGVFTLDEGDSATYTVEMDEEPDGDFTVDLSYASGDAMTVSPSSITFTRTGEASDSDKWEWDEPQAITVTALNDRDHVNEFRTIKHQTTVGDDDYVLGRLELTIQDSALSDLTFDPEDRKITVNEGSTATYAVALASDPGATAAVTAQVESRPFGDGIDVWPTELTFTGSATGNWATAQTFTVTGLPDDDEFDDQSEIEHTIRVGNVTILRPTVYVTVSDSNRAPYFEEGVRITRSVPENSPEGTNVGGPVVALDLNSDTLTYTVQDQVGGPYEVDNSGQITVGAGANLDYETRPKEEVTLVVKDPGGLQDTIAVEIRITDEPEPPAVSGNDDLEWQENRTGNIARYTATDVEGDSFTWSVTGADSSFFSIDTLGYLTFVDPPDFEASRGNIYEPVVTATDTDGNAGELNVKITVTNVNEPPTVTGDDDIAIDENTHTFSRTYSASDPEGAAPTFTWSLSGSDGGDFNIDRNTGELTFRNTPDYESPADSNRNNEYLVTVLATDEGNLRGELAVTVTVNDVNEAPTITGDDTPPDFPENSVRSVATYRATDPERGTITWSVSGSDDDDFEISNTGVLTFASIPDFENPTDANQDNEYLVTVEARDDGFNTDRLSVTVIVINSTGAEEPTITTTSRPVLSYQESGTGTVYTYSARDPQGRLVTWSLSGDDANDFSITRDSRGRGVLTFASPPDFEMPADSNQDNVYEITVVVTDDQGLTDSFDVTIAVTNHHESLEPAITTRASSGVTYHKLSYQENRTSTVYTYSARNYGTGSLSWSVSGTDAGDFDITTDNSGRGVLTFASSPDFESPADSDGGNDYEITVAVTNTGGYTDRLDVVVTVTEVNEGPEVTGGGDSFTVQENQDWPGATFTASDPEGGTIARWNLGGRDGSDFNISETGVLTFRNVPDYERPDDGDRDNVYEVEVRPYDGRYYGSHDVTVTVEDVTEITGPATLNRSENYEGLLATYSATGQGDLTVAPSWRLTGTDSGDFAISEQGELTFRSIPDHERPADSNRDNEYLFTVQASDGRYYGTLDVTVTVLPVNEPPTIITTSSSATAMRHPENRTSRLYTYRATDPEGVGTVMWSLTGADARFFTINERGEFYFNDTSPPDYETRATPGQTDNFVVYNVTVVASDGTYASMLDVTVTVTDVDEGPEVSGQNSFTIVENRNLSNAVYTATDPEGLNVARWSVGGRDGGDFFITQGGTLYFRSPPDYERPADGNRDNVYEVSIQPSDGRNTGSYPVTVTVTEFNEPPEFRSGSRVSFTQQENRVSRLYTFSATDPEGGDVTWSVGGSDGSHFTIDERGQFSFNENNPPDFDTPGDQGGDNIYIATIQARDPQANTAGLPVVVQVTEVNEGPTITRQGSAPGSVPENQDQATVLATYAASDPERPSVTITQWSLSGRDGGDFVINALGQMMFRNPPDYERPADGNRDNVYEVTIRSSDGRYTSTLEEVQMVTVADVNEPPTITTTSRTEFSQQENRASTLYTFRATDPERATIVWMAGGNDGSHFTIDEQGRFSFDETRPPDYDSPGDSNRDNVYNVTIQVGDGQGNTAELEVTVTVTNHNEGEEPTISTRRPPTTYQENGTSAVYTFRASDPQRQAIAWRLEGEDAGDFTLTTDSSGRGVLTFTSPPNFETPADANGDNAYELSVVASDSDGNSDRVDFTITVTNHNEGVEPTISTRRPPATYRENDTRTFYTFRASDPQRDTIAWSLEGTDHEDFTITADSSGRGVLTFSSPPDYESPVDDNRDNEYELTVVASDDDNNSDRVSFAITVTDLNEGPTISLAATATTTVPENAADTQVLADYMASDPENTGANIFRWSTTGRDGGDFVISELGELRFRNSPDYERPADADRDNVYEVIVRAYDGRAYGMLEEPLEITVTEVNEAPVITTKSRTEFSQQENSTSFIYTYRATDQDEDDVVRWTVEGTDGGDFAIYNGILGFRLLPDFEEPVDENEDNVYEITVVASDGNLRDTVNAVITITDQSEGPVIAGSTSYTFAENYEITQALGTYAATDAKDGRAVFPRWSLSGRDGGDFVIDQVSGVLSFRNTPDYDRPADADRDNVYEVTVRGHDSRAYGNLNVTVTVTDINENDPVVTGRTSHTVRENTDRAIYTYRATDADLNTEFAWSVEGVDGSNFAINPDGSGRGVLTFGSPPDFEQPRDQNNDNEYEVTVVASDGTNRGTLDVTVAVTAENEGPTVSGPTAFTINENQDLTSAAYSASDPEAIGGVTTTITWRLSGRDGGDFNIDRETGVLTFRTPPDYERPADADRDNTYEVTVRAYDGRAYGDYDVTVMVEDVVEITGTGDLTRSENFDGSLATYSAAGQGILTVEPDWRLAGTDSGDFNIDRETGVLTFRNTPDHERPADSNRDNVYTFTVQVSDGSYYGTVDVTVAVEAVNERPVISGRDSLSFRENTPTTTRLYTYSAQDAEGDDFTWHLGGLDASDFTITPDSSGRGVLFFAVPPNFDNPAGSGTDGNEYLVTVQARDAQGNGEFSVTITITDQNEGATVSGRQTIAVPENQDASQVLATYSATDPEGEAIIRWSLSGSDGGDFLISEDGELTFRNSPDFDRPADSNRDNEYLVTVRAYDGRTYGNLDVTVAVSNINEHAPVIRSGSRTEHTYREEGTSAIYTYSATDQDKDDVINWTTGGTDGNLFEFDDRNGLMFREPPDYEIPGDMGGDNEYNLTVIATDTGGPAASLDVTVTVTSLEEGPEVSGTATYTVTEGGMLNGATFTGRDPEDPTAEVTGWRLAGSDAGDFTITSTGTNTAELAFRTTPDYDRPADSNRDNEYLLTVRAYNGSTYGSLDVTVTVTDTNEANPVVTGSQNLSFRENTATATRLYTYRATDMDLDTEIMWSVRGTDGNDFDINEDSSGRGELYFSSIPDYEEPADLDDNNEYEITVVASDGSNEGILDVTLTVTEVNEGPEVTGSATRTVSENFDQVLAIYTAIDPEGSEVTRWNLGGSDSGDFTITDTGQEGGPYTAELTFRIPPDYDRPADGNRDNEYLVTVRPYDGRVYGNYEVTITVTADNEPPVITGDDARDFRENGTGTIYTYRATDPEGDDFTWSVSSAGDGSYFAISDSGVLAFQSPPDFESPPRPDDNDYEVTVVANDGNGGQGTFQVTVTVTDQNEGPVVAETSDNTAFTVQENHDEVLFTYSATDPEGVDITGWSVTGRDGDDFTINEDGELSFRNPPDDERRADSNRDNEYEVTVRASDGRYYGTLDVTVTVTPVNEAPEFHSSSKDTFSYEENDTDDLFTYRATDPERSEVSWSLSGTDIGAFTISEEGVLSFSASPDYESPTDSNDDNVYEVTVEVRDGDGNIARLEVTVTVTNLTD